MSEYLEKQDVWLTCTEMPATIKGFCKCVGTDQIVVINNVLSEEAQKKAFEHEIQHLKNNDLFDETEVEVIENKIDNG